MIGRSGKGNGDLRDGGDESRDGGPMVTAAGGGERGAFTTIRKS